jgi:hypothetical protein
VNEEHWAKVIAEEGGEREKFFFLFILLFFYEKDKRRSEGTYKQTKKELRSCVFPPFFTVVCVCVCVLCVQCNRLRLAAETRADGID